MCCFYYFLRLVYKLIPLVEHFTFCMLPEMLDRISHLQSVEKSCNVYKVTFNHVKLHHLIHFTPVYIPFYMFIILSPCKHLIHLVCFKLACRISCLLQACLKIYADRELCFCASQLKDYVCNTRIPCIRQQQLCSDQFSTNLGPVRLCIRLILFKQHNLWGNSQSVHVMFIQYDMCCHCHC